MISFEIKDALESSMEWVLKHWLLILLLTAYTVFLLTNAYRGAIRSEGITDFFVGGRQMGGIAIGVSFFATFASTNIQAYFRLRQSATRPTQLLL